MLRYEILVTWPAVSKCTCLWIIHLKNVVHVNPSVLNMASDSKHDPGSWIWFRCDQKHKWMISVFRSIISKGPCISPAAFSWAPPVCAHFEPWNKHSLHPHLCLQGNMFTPKYSLLWALQEAEKFMYGIKCIYGFSQVSLSNKKGSNFLITHCE